MEVIASGYRLPEGPRPLADGAIAFSDVLGGGIHELRPGREPTALATDRRGIGGLVPRRDGGYVASGKDLVLLAPGGEVEEQLLALEGATGFNDMTCDESGRVVVGSMRFHPFRGERPVPGEIYRLDGAGTVEELARGIDWPNGIGLAPDGATMYVSDYSGARVLSYGLEADGAAEPHGVFAAMPAGAADGLAVDERGGVWVAMGSAAAIARFTPDGVLDHTLDLPLAFVTSLCFAGDELDELIITGLEPDGGRGGVVLRTEAGERGLPVCEAAA